VFNHSEKTQKIYFLFLPENDKLFSFKLLRNSSEKQVRSCELLVGWVMLEGFYHYFQNGKVQFTAFESSKNKVMQTGYYKLTFSHAPTPFYFILITYFIPTDVAYDKSNRITQEHKISKSLCTTE